MKLHYIGLLLFAIAYNNLFSQQLSTAIFKDELVNSNGVINDQLLVMKTMENQYPGYSEQVSKVFKENKSRDNQSYNKNILHEVSVVVHVVHQTSEENLPDSVIYSQIDQHNFVFEGKTPLMDLYRITGIDGKQFEENKGESDTIAGFCIEQAGKILLKNEKVIFQDIVFTVEAADKRRIKQIKVTLPKVEVTE